MSGGERSKIDAGWKSWISRGRRPQNGGGEKSSSRVRYRQIQSSSMSAAKLFLMKVLMCLQPEDHELWASHFDSLQRKPPVSAAAPTPAPLQGFEQRDWEPTSRLSLLSEAMSTCGGESVRGAGVDTTCGHSARTRYRGSLKEESGIKIQTFPLKKCCFLFLSAI